MALSLVVVVDLWVCFVVYCEFGVGVTSVGLLLFVVGSLGWGWFWAWWVCGVLVAMVSSWLRRPWGCLVTSGCWIRLICVCGYGGFASGWGAFVAFAFVVCGDAV